MDVRLSVLAWLTVLELAGSAAVDQDSSRHGNVPTMEAFLVGFGSCLMQSKLHAHEVRGYRPFRMLSQVQRHPLQSFLFIGDAVYADFPHFYSTKCCSHPPYPQCDQRCFANGTIGSPEVLEKQYAMLMKDEFFARFIADVPSVFMWDDHELFDNFWNGTSHIQYWRAREAFQKHLGFRNPLPYRPGEMYFVHRVPDRDLPLAEFFVLDGRTHRNESMMLGPQQTDDLRKWLRGSLGRVRWRFIVSTTMFGEVAKAVGSDNWSQYRDEKRAMLQMVLDEGVEGVVLMSGDAHFAAIVEHHVESHGRRCALLEVASSPLASVPLVPKGPVSRYTGQEHGFDERVTFLHTGEHLYATIHLNQSWAIVQHFAYKEDAGGQGQEELLSTVAVSHGPLCDDSQKEDGPHVPAAQMEL